MSEGLFCEPGGFYIDPWQPVARAVVTHAHSDHACRGSAQYLTAADGVRVLKVRMNPDAEIDSLPYGEALSINGVSLSFHPAGHILGSAQVRLEYDGHVVCVSGDYKTVTDPTCRAFEPVRCDTFVTESTFGLPIYRWPAQSEVFADINAWWRANRDAGKPSLIFAYALGKAQRVLAGVDTSIAPICCHGAVERVNQEYRASGVDLPATEYAGLGNAKRDWQGALIIAPPSALGTPWMRKFGDAGTAFVSGWMQIRGVRRRRSVDRGFALSDHADWPGLNDAIHATGAERILVTHGYTAQMVRWLREQGFDSDVLQTAFVGERDDVDVESEANTDQLESEAPA